MYHFFKKRLLLRIIEIMGNLKSFNIKMYYRRLIKVNTKTYKPPVLNSKQKADIKGYYSKFGFQNINVKHHQYYAGFNGIFSVRYIPEDIFHPYIEPLLNNNRQWPALLDKNLLDRIFIGVKQPNSIVNNINGFYYHDGVQINQSKAIEVCLSHKFLAIKPSIDSGGGKGVVGFRLTNKSTDYKDLSLKELFDLFSKDFVVQEVIVQHPTMATLNSSSVNTIRLLTYLTEGKVHIMASVIRIGGSNSFTDSASMGGISCAINKDGSLKEIGYYKTGGKRYKTDSGVKLKGFIIPSYKRTLELIERIHFLIPYFRIVAWDVAIGENGEPILIEYNTYKMGLSSLQIAYGPFEDKYVDELLGMRKNR